VEFKIDIRECTRVEELTECVQIQREVFSLPESELSPVRHLVVTREAGGFVTGAFDGPRLAGFVLSVPTFFDGERGFYSHMTGVRESYQSKGIGAQLKWAQRTEALARGVELIKWTFEPIKPRNAFFNLEKLGAVVREYKPNFYGTNYGQPARPGRQIDLPSDRLFAEWHLTDPVVAALSEGKGRPQHAEPIETIEVTKDWAHLVANEPEAAAAELNRIRTRFMSAFAADLVVRGFERHDNRPAYLLFRD
jgi:predicted GNAT superfamily acetyltransferase